MIKQLSVFIENREGRICDVTKVMKDQNINILSLSLADTQDYGIMRLIVTEKEKCLKALKEARFSAKLVDVVAIKVSNKVGEMHDFLRWLVDAGVSIEYMYSFIMTDGPVIVMKVSNKILSEDVLKEHGYHLLSDSEIK